MKEVRKDEPDASGISGSHASKRIGIRFAIEVECLLPPVLLHNGAGSPAQQTPSRVSVEERSNYQGLLRTGSTSLVNLES
jgi:hypothetical protein